MQNIKTPIAKTIGTDLIDHNRNVSFVAKYITYKILTHPEPEIVNAVEIGALLHDIGKAIPKFQELLLGKTKKTNLKFRHNEIGWAFLTKYLNKNNELINNSVYWHHGISNKIASHSCDDIIDMLNNDDIKILKEITEKLLGNNCFRNETNICLTKTPVFYKNDNEEYNRKFSIIRTCIISADRIVSQLEENVNNLSINNNNVSTYIDSILTTIIKRNNGFVIDKSPYQPEDRFISQLDISKKCEGTTIVKAPAGFGKTLVGLIWSSRFTEKIIWVCPRNVVVHSVYDSILNELDALGLSDVTVELFLTGNLVKKNHNNLGEFNSDIIVTNIDNFESPTIDDRVSYRQFLLYSANVVFDEYHEFVSDAPYFASFINIMKIRNRNTNGKTLLLSASPVSINHMWDSLGKKTLILPDENTHYPAVHNKKYLINVKNEYDYPTTETGSNLIIFNSISEAQYHKSKLNNSMLFHSEFQSNTKHEKFDFLIKNYGKKSIKSYDKQSVVSTVIAQASFDVSFHKLFESCLSPEASIQRAGRCDRFDDYGVKESVITIFKPKDRKLKTKHSRAENSVTEILYDVVLMNKWFDDISQYNNKRITLNELYVIYNKHVTKYKELRQKYFNRQYRMSLYNLSGVYPIKFNTKKEKNKIITAGGNKLRSSGSEIFYIVSKYDNDKEYVGLFTAGIYKSIDIDFNEEGNIRSRLLGSMKTIMKSTQDEFDYSEILENKNKITLDEIRKFGKKSNSPYIRYDKVYHPEYGLITHKRLYEILHN